MAKSDETRSPTARTELTRPFRGVSAAERQRLRREQLIDAGYELFGTEGIANVTLTQVCAEAGLIKRYFYESFAAMDDLIDAVVERAIERLGALTLPAIATEGQSDPSRMVRAGMNALQEDPRLTRLLVVEANSGALMHRRHRLINLTVDMWLAADPQQPRDSHEAARRRLRAYAYIGALGEVALASNDGRLELSSDEVTEELVTLLHAITAVPG